MKLMLSDLTGAGLKNIDPLVETVLFIGDMSKEVDVNRIVEVGVARFGAIHHRININLRGL
jgi:hypothetical protein